MKDCPCLKVSWETLKQACNPLNIIFSECMWPRATHPAPVLLVEILKTSSAGWFSSRELNLLGPAAHWCFGCKAKWTLAKTVGFFGCVFICCTTQHTTSWASTNTSQLVSSTLLLCTLQKCYQPSQFNDEGQAKWNLLLLTAHCLLYRVTVHHITIIQYYWTLKKKEPYHQIAQE